MNLARLERVLLRARAALEKPRTDSSVRIGLPVGGGMEIIQINTILYVEKLGRRVFLVGRDGDRLAISESLQKLQNILEPYGFFRCHQSFLIRLAAVRSIRMDETKNSYNILFFDTDAAVPLSRGKYKELRDCLARNGLTIY